MDGRVDLGHVGDGHQLEGEPTSDTAPEVDILLGCDTEIVPK
jgi:hypothetical protein